MQLIWKFYHFIYILIARKPFFFFFLFLHCYDVGRIRGSGNVDNIVFQNIKMENVKNPIIIDQNYCDQETPCKEQVNPSHQLQTQSQAFICLPSTQLFSILWLAELSCPNKKHSLQEHHRHECNKNDHNIQLQQDLTLPRHYAEGYKSSIKSELRSWLTLHVLMPWCWRLGVGFLQSVHVSTKMVKHVDYIL